MKQVYPPLIPVLEVITANESRFNNKRMYSIKTANYQQTRPEHHKRVRDTPHCLLP